MKSTGKIIYEVRKQKGISQEELAIMAKVNLRTIQRLENDINEPRKATINLICEALEIDQNDLKSQVEKGDSASLIQKWECNLNSVLCFTASGVPPKQWLPNRA